MDAPPDRDSDLGDDSPMSHNEEDLSENDHDLDEGESSDEGLGVNGGLSAIGGLENHLGIPQLHRNGLDLTAEHRDNERDVLDKLKMQVQEMKDFDMARESPLSTLTSSHLSSLVSMSQGGHLGQPGSHMLGPPPAFQMPINFPYSPVNFMPPPSQAVAAPPCDKPSPQNAPRGGSASSSSSEGSASSQQTWSFEEQFKQVRQDNDDKTNDPKKDPGLAYALYEINDDPKRKELLDELFMFMQKRGTPINRLPIMAKSVLDLFELYNLVIARGGLVDVINKKLWQEIIKGLHLPSSITSAAFTLRTQYMKYLYPYECEKKNLSTPQELQAAIDGNRREGRRSSYGNYENQMQNQMQLPSTQRSPIPPSLQLTHPMTPLALVTHQQQAHLQQSRAAMAHAAHGTTPAIQEAHMMEYLKILQHTELYNGRLHARSPTTEITSRDAINALELSRVQNMLLNNYYMNNTSPPNSVRDKSKSPPNAQEPQREALNLSDAPEAHTSSTPITSFKRELPDSDLLPPPPAKRGHTSTSNGIREDTDEEIVSPEKNLNPLSFGANFKIASKVDSINGGQQLVVSMELNGVMYQGTLFANAQGSSQTQHRDSRPLVS